MKKKAAILILNWNGLELLKKFLPILIKNTPSEIANIYLIDNNSTDNSITYVASNFNNVNIIQLDNNYGFAKAYNLVVPEIQEEYIILLNNDIEVKNGWLNYLIEAIESDESIGACQPKILSYQNRKQFEYAGACGGFIDILGYPFCRGRIFNVFEEDKGQYDDIKEIFWASGACLLTKKKLYIELGGLNDYFFAHMEEIDYCWRLWARGFKVLVIPKSTVYHVGGATLNHQNPKKTYFNFRNNLFLLYLNLPKKKFFLLYIRILFDLLAVLKFILSKEFSNSKSVLKALLHFFKMKKFLKKNRLINLKQTIKENIPTIYKKSIVFNFFILKKKTFNKLNF